MSTKTSHQADLVFGQTLTPHPDPLIPPTRTSPRILIVGGGVIGLVNSWVFLDKGYRFAIVSKEYATYGKAQRLTSQIAGALWELPPAVCGQHTDAISLQRSKPWTIVSYGIWSAIAGDDTLEREAGVRMRKAKFFVPVKVEENKAQLAKMREMMAQEIQGFRHSG
jgi:D-amino-acid oxidase